MKTQDTARPKLYIGIDIHKRSWKIHTSTDLFDGKSMSMPPSAEGLRKYVEKHFSGYEVSTAYECGSCGYKAHRRFEEYGWKSIVFHPADMKRSQKSKYQKTDKIDARMICRELKDKRLKGIHIPEVKREHLRCMFRRRNELVKQMRKIKTQIKMQLLYLGIEIPKEYDNTHWSHAFRQWIRSQQLSNTTVNYTIASRMDEFDFVDKELRAISVALRKYCKKEYKKDYNLLRSVPGIGGIVACGILSEIGDLRRFKNFKQMASYVGLIPSMYQSGDREITKGMTPRANRLLRSYFIEATWQALRRDPVLQNYYRSHQGKNIKKILVKVARKLLSRTHAVIRTETPYEVGIVK